MHLANKRIILTGATGGLGSILAKRLAEKGAKLALVGRNADKLNALKTEIERGGNHVITIEADLSNEDIPQKVVQLALEKLGDIDIVINNAGILDFIAFEDQADSRIKEVIQTNVTSVLQLTKAALPIFQRKNAGHILFVGSIFGSLGFPHYATYCASKFAIHGFSQALRRELVSTKIGITYIAPRGINTAMNADNAIAMSKKAGNKMDSPEKVAEVIISSLESEKQEVFIGQPQSFFAWLNGVAPRIVNLGLKKQTALASSFLRK